MYWTVRNAQTGHNQRYNELAANPAMDGKPIYLAEDAGDQGTKGTGREVHTPAWYGSGKRHLRFSFSCAMRPRAIHRPEMLRTVIDNATGGNGGLYTPEDPFLKSPTAGRAAPMSWR